MSRLSAVRGAGIDTLAITALGTLALFGLRNTYVGWSYLVVGAAGLAIGAACALLAHRLRQPALVLAALVIVAFFVAGMPLVLPGSSMLSLDTWRELAAAAVLSWKELLTTLAPVDGAGTLLVVPFILGLACGAAGLALARGLDRSARPGSVAELLRTAAPAVVPAGTLVVVTALGTAEPAADLLNGVVFAVVGLAWLTLRLRRQRPPVYGARQPLRQVLTAAAVLSVAAIVAAVVGPVLPGSATARTVLRDVIVPPFDLSAYPSPLVGFRKYTKDANKLWDQTLFTVTGLPEGANVRIATLDDYDGSVWGASDADGFRRVGARVAQPSTSRDGPLVTVQVTIAPAYGAATDANAWLPQVGAVSEVTFQGAREAELARSLHYNQGLSAGIVTARLTGGDSYTLTVALPATTLPKDVVPGGRPNLSESAQAMLSSKVATWAGTATELGDRLRAVARYLHDSGAYSDGGPGETQFLPGHSTGRLGSFLQGDQPVGDDEQYAATFALIANHLGIPARVVLGAHPDARGVVRGSAVHAWVELLTDTGWVAVPETEFMPDPAKRPKRQPPQETQDADAAVVPPPNAIRLPRTPTDTSRDEAQIPPLPPTPWWVWFWNTIRAYVVWGGPPTALAALVVGGILGFKARRRRRRRTTGSPAHRFAGGWRELVDGARDTGVVVPSGLTLQEQAGFLERAQLLPTEGLTRLVERIEQAVFGPDDPTPEDAADFWRTIDADRADLVRQWSIQPFAVRRRTLKLRRLRRAVAALSLRSLRPPSPGPVVPIGGEPS